MPVHRRLAVFALAGLGLSACQPGSGRLADADRDAIHAAVDNFTKAVLAGDFTTAASYYTQDGMLLPPNGPVVEGRLEGNGDLAYARLTYAVTTMPPGAKVPLNDTGKLIIILRKQINGTWLTTRGIWNSDLTGRTIITSRNESHAYA